MPALELLDRLGEADRAAVESARTSWETFSHAVPFVRVVVPAQGNARHAIELGDVYFEGWARAAHKSNRAREIEQRLQRPDSLYFHAGRAHPAYGLGVLVFSDIETLEVTPFGLGALNCVGCNTPPTCMQPVAHDTLVNQSTFVQNSLFPSPWRDSAATYAALYFGTDVDRYFAEGANARPTRADPDGIFTASGNDDWRFWTIELRTSDVNLIELVKQGRLLWWAVNSTLETAILNMELNQVRQATFFRYLQKANASKRVTGSDDVILSSVEALIRAHVCP